MELTLEVWAVAWTGTGTAGVQWWLLEAGGEVSGEKATDNQTDPEPGHPRRPRGNVVSISSTTRTPPAIHPRLGATGRENHAPERFPVTYCSALTAAASKDTALGLLIGRR